ncbi:taurine catabolism dioxygenase tauD tfdA [Seminavis robusta]|uniref:Taurine catabolism dioxygenase tauD tfdA n=1 Tax=Seminavis robusta TaxID=568900 RepID=A0A9N8HTC1_9STRA|nr:taurine catabolism dioxygenase tauD tfdA [Seminavis robusta]|eukprot:Sro1559_g282500.1 taurine catabolism dioxygenase tauD tfdA (430) ;mRNA; f:20838-22338
MVRFLVPFAALVVGVSAFAPSHTTTSSRPSLVLSAASVAETPTAEPPLSPLTSWGDQISDITSLQEKVRSDGLPEFAPTISAKELGIAGDEAAQLKYFEDNAMEIKTKLQAHAAVVFRDFELMKKQDGFQQMYGAIGMKPCLDPLHSVSARPTVDGTKNSPVYEAVNKESRKNFFIGMHNEFVGTRAPRAAAFVCFKAAETGGEFLIADGRRMFRDLDPQLVQELYQRSIRYSVMELPFFGWIDNLPEPVQNPIMGVVRGLVSAAINAKVDFSVELLWGEGGYDNVKMLQARAPSQPPIVLHPITGEPTWFCNVHSHSSKLRKDRESVYGAERFEDGASQINKSDMFFGDDGELTEEQLKQLDEVTMKNVQFVKMTEGDVVLLDNYKCMHGRNVFDGTRKHGVAWFEGWEGEEDMKSDESLLKTVRMMA